MVSSRSIPPHQQIRTKTWQRLGVQRIDVHLNKGRVSDVLRVFHGPCRIFAMFLEITEAVQNAACNMSWVLRSDTGGYRVLGDTVNIQAAALGDFYVAELDATNIIKATTATGLVNGYWYEAATATNGVIVPPGGIDFVFSNTNMSSGKGTLTIAYVPIIDDAMIVAEDWQTSTTSSSTSTSSTSSTASTSSTTSTTSSTASSSSTTSTTSSTSSTASTTSSTSSTASTTSTASSTSSTSSTASTTSTSSSTSSTSSTTSTSSSTSTTSTTSSTTTTWPPEIP